MAVLTCLVSSAPNGAVPVPDPKVTKAEDDFMKDPALALGRLSTDNTFPTRPGHGTQGTKIVVFANSFGVEVEKNLSFYRYNVEVQPVGKAPKASKPKVKRLMVILLEQAGFRGAMTDYRSTLLSRERLENIPYDAEMSFRAEGQDDPPENPARYRIIIQETGSVLVSDLLHHLKIAPYNTPEFPQRLDVVQALNIVISHFPQLKSDIVTIGQNRHFSIAAQNQGNSRPLGQGLEALRGYFKSLRPATQRFLLNANITHAVCFAALPLSRLFQEIGVQHNQYDAARKIKRLRLQRLHLLTKKNKAGNTIPSVVTFWNFATTNDGASHENRPQVASYAAGPKNVKFFLNENQADSAPSTTPQGKAGSSKKPTKSSGGGRYVSVWDYFHRSEFHILTTASKPL